MKIVVQAIERTRIYSIKESKHINSMPRISWDNKDKVITIKEIENGDNHILSRTYEYDDILIIDYKGNKVDAAPVLQYDLEEDILYMKSNVIVKLIETNKEEIEKKLDIKLREWNKKYIEEHEELNAYCNLHNLDKETADINELKKVVPSFKKRNNDQMDSFMNMVNNSRIFFNDKLY